MLTYFSQMLSLYLNRIGWSLTWRERRSLMDYRKWQSRNTLKSANSSWEETTLTNANLIQKENLNRWSLVKFFICRMGNIVLCHSMPLFQLWTLQIEAVGFDEGAVSGHFSQNNKNRRKTKLFFMAEYDSFLVWPTSLVKEHILTVAKCSKGQASLSTKLLYSYVSLLVLQ